MLNRFHHTNTILFLLIGYRLVFNFTRNTFESQIGHHVTTNLMDFSPVVTSVPLYIYLGKRGGEEVLNIFRPRLFRVSFVYDIINGCATIATEWFSLLYGPLPGVQLTNQLNYGFVSCEVQPDIFCY